ILARYFLAKVHRLRREPAATQEFSEATLALAEAHGATTYRGTGRVLRGWALAHQGQHDEGQTQLREGLEICRRSGGVVNFPQMLAMLGEVCARRDRYAEALRAAAEGLAVVERTGEPFFQPDLHRLRGEFLLKQPADADAGEAEACFRRALDMTRRQGARSFAL